MALSYDDSTISMVMFIVIIIIILLNIFLSFYFCLFFTPLFNSQGMKKLRYAIQKVQKSSWNEPYSSSSFTKQSCNEMALYR